MKKIIIGNLKMNLLSPSERERYLKLFKKEAKKIRLKNTEVVLCPPFIHLENFSREFKRSKIEVGVQNVFWKRAGAYTGEISPRMAINFGANFSIIGHSERRIYFRETDETINKKIMEALKSGLRIIFCVGETEGEKLIGKTGDVLARQIMDGLQGISRNAIEKIIFAYEPVWAIGSGKTPLENEILEAKLIIKKMIFQKYGVRYAEKSKIIYGGSVDSKNVSQVCVKTEMDGVLVGGESLNPREFLKIAEIIDKQETGSSV